MRHSGRPVLSVALAPVFGYSLTIAPMLRSGSRTGRGDPNRPSGLMDPAGWAVGVREVAMNHPPSRCSAVRVLLRRRRRPLDLRLFAIRPGGPAVRGGFVIGHATGGSCAAADCVRRRSGPGAALEGATVLRDRPPGTRGGAGRAHRVPRPRGLRRIPAPARRPDPLAVARPTGRCRDRRHAGEGRRVPSPVAGVGHRRPDHRRRPACHRPWGPRCATPAERRRASTAAR